MYPIWCVVDDTWHQGLCWAHQEGVVKLSSIPWLAKFPKQSPREKPDGHGRRWGFGPKHSFAALSSRSSVVRVHWLSSIVIWRITGQALEMGAESRFPCCVTVNLWRRFSGFLLFPVRADSAAMRTSKWLQSTAVASNQIIKLHGMGQVK